MNDNSSQSPLHPPAPILIRSVVGCLCGAVLLSSLIMALTSLFIADRAIWMLFGFEAIASIAAATGMFFAFGRYRDGPALALVCIAGTFFVGAVLGWLSSRGTPFLGPDQARILKLWIFSRVGTAGLLALFAAWLVLSRGGRSWNYAAKSALTGIPVLVLLAAAVFMRDKLSSIVDSLPDWALGGIALIAGVALGALVCASLHCMIRAFEEGRPRPTKPKTA